KLYMVSYRNVGVFHEHLVNKILDDIVKSCKPRWVTVEAAMNPRGGIATIVKASYKARVRK
ncbi:MAG: NADPH-dependent 7-cyano-7-deazaguanine reductase QueF, partial [Candidatus Omnitrophica bacterium]|nr:NADPH-dependent 7-cyano-7-deazaguanine reductase QueF [Candidatus Omnitrophota bacterium]